MNLGQMIDAVITQGGFDSTTGAASRDAVAGWINDRYRDLLAQTGWQKATVELGPTVAGQSTYVIPDAVNDVRKVLVDGNEYVRASAEELFEARANSGYVSGGFGAFAPGYVASGAAVIDLFPTPTEAGKSIQALAATAAVAMSAETDSPVIPEDLQQGLIDGAIATGLRRIYERHDDAAAYEARYDNPAGGGTVQRLKRRANSRVGSGPQKVRVWG